MEWRLLTTSILPNVILTVGIGSGFNHLLDEILRTHSGRQMEWRYSSRVGSFHVSPVFQQGLNSFWSTDSLREKFEYDVI
jgi:hypothetical protein